MNLLAMVKRRKKEAHEARMKGPKMDYHGGKEEAYNDVVHWINAHEDMDIQNAKEKRWRSTS